MLPWPAAVRVDLAETKASEKAEKRKIWLKVLTSFSNERNLINFILKYILVFVKKIKQNMFFKIK